jgi:protein-L-isoaspartate(D-aspartate) O-methyltransferase
MSTIVASPRIKPSLSSPNTALVFFLLNLVLVLGIPVPPRAGVGEENDAFTRERRQMVERDLRQRGIKDERVLTAMAAVPRHLFVPEPLRGSAYDDRPLSIGEGQTISQPYIVALMTELLDLTGDERVLEIGTGSGYQTAVLARLAARVYSIEIIPALGAGAEKLLKRLDVANVEIKIGDGFFGWEEKAPFDAILLTAAAPRIPEQLWRQLREGGRLIMPMGQEGKTQRLMRFRKVSGKPEAEEVTGVIFVPLTGEIQRRNR